jgi:hypothetical protein
MLSAGGPRTWQPFISHQQNLTESLLPRKGAPDKIHNTPADRCAGSYPVSLLSQPMKQLRKSHIYQQHVTRLTGPISQVYDRYVQYLLMGVNPSVLNRHRWRLQPWRCRLATYHSRTFPISCLPCSPKGPGRSPV